MSISNAAFIVIAVIAIGYLYRKLGGQGLRLLGTLILVGAIIGIVLLTVLIHSFQAFTSTTRVATVQASPVVNQPHTMAISMTTYDGSGGSTHEEYELQGDRWELNADVIEYQPWVNLLGVKNGFSLSRLTSQYDDTNAHTIQPVDLQHGQTFAIPFVEKSHYRNGVLEPADSATYNVYVTIQGDVYASHA